MYFPAQELTTENNGCRPWLDQFTLYIAYLEQAHDRKIQLLLIKTNKL